MNQEDGFLKNAKVTIVGLGLMGGSLAKALRGKCASIYGFDTNKDTVNLALETQTIDAGSTQPTHTFPETDVIILAIPIGAILAFLQELPLLCAGNVIVMDLGSTKTSVIDQMALLPERFDPLGAHPICGKEHAGFAYADANLFRGAPFGFTSLPNTSKHALFFAEELVFALGAVPIWLDPQTHDRSVAITSHLPYLLANSLAAITPLEVSLLTGPGYRSTTRLAPSPTSMTIDILKTNRDHILNKIHCFQSRLDQIAACLEDQDFLLLERLLIEGAERYDDIQKSIVKGRNL
jgi:prephenate dehydrogenase